MARPSSPVRPTAPRSRSGSATTPLPTGAPGVEPPADRVGPEALSAGLLPSAATRYSEMVGNASSAGPALRYLESSRLLVPPPAPLDPAEQRKLTADLADLVTHVITAVLDGLGLSDADWERGKKIAMEALMAATREGWSPL